MLMLLERRGYNSRAARVSEKKVSQGWRNSKYKVMPKGIGDGFMRKHSGVTWSGHVESYAQRVHQGERGRS